MNRIFQELKISQHSEELCGGTVILELTYNPKKEGI